MSTERIRALWDFNDPEGSEARFRDELSRADGDWALELQTQVARAQGLQRRFDDARATLDALPPTPELPGNRWETLALLERGRVTNSSGDKAGARPWFDRAAKTPVADLRIDAIHMQAIVADPDEALQLNEQAIAEAQASNDPNARRWLGSLLNNTAWTHHDLGNLDRALQLFQDALAFRQEAGDPATIRIAQWCVARCLRSLNRVEEALSIQEDLATQEESGFNEEELGECLFALGRLNEAKPHFKRAHELLSQDAWVSESEPERLERLLRLASTES